MTSFSGLGIGLGLVFGLLLFALVAEVYYLLWWKKKRVIINSNIQEEEEEEEEEEDYSSSYAKELLHLICWKGKFSFSHQPNTATNLESGRRNQDSNNEQDLEMGSSKEVVLMTFDEENVESELIRIHNLAGPPRFLFTIKEETKEDLDSEDGRSTRKGSRTRSLSDILMASSPLRSSFSSSPLHPLDSYKHQGFNNPLFESSSSAAEAELNRLRCSSSPPPKFKFLREAEEKLYRRLMEEAQKTGSKNCEINKAFSYTPMAAGNGVKAPSSSSQVTPLASSPPSTQINGQEMKKPN